MEEFIYTRNGLLEDSEREKAEQIWNEILSNPRNYAKEPEGLKNTSFAEIISRQIEIKSGTYLYFNDISKEGIRDIASLFLLAPDVRKSSSFDNVYKAIRDEIRSGVLLKAESQKSKSFEEIEISILSRIFANIKKYSYYFPVNGLALTDKLKINFGNIQIFEFNADDLNLLLEQDPKVCKENKQEYTNFLEQGFLEKICIKCSCVGDQRFSEKLARLRIEETINYLRYVICLHLHERIYEEAIPKITLSSKSSIDSTHFLIREPNSGRLSFHWGVKRKNLYGQDFSLSARKISQLREDVYYCLITRLLNTEKRTELEDCVTTAINWIGEAQNSFSIDNSFLKFWTALECLFPKKDAPKKGSRTFAIARGLTMLLTDFGGYAFIEDEDEFCRTFEGFCTLYQRRGDLVHDGLRNGVSQIELAEICKLSCWVVLCVFNLIEHGKKQVREINQDIGYSWGKLSQSTVNYCKTVAKKDIKK